ncbi:hypothetical protein TraAM80_10249 [Trypanosoma rangeli]|uniref:Mucin-like glycoprotein n=1 Tax=Trypanosoma rangeli TaxID=5698 RepID=A0A3R7M3C7_TRYRA|nr:uncharacterized protein TraAM80_10249 [Trypanosoma rangeli]RNE95391.1 hypothetical protein TraAM80_10249 [Trypanosoma rangeli]|eukprot:RNE95391.1 hypothetical protein TraAM80_10249 [Trypanosoma rangeli]
MHYYGPLTVETASAGGSATESICLLAKLTYVEATCPPNCSSSARESSNDVAFTMYFKAEISELPEKLKGKTVTLDGSRIYPLWKSGVCNLPQIQHAAGAVPGHQTPGGQQPQSQAAITSSSEGTQQGGSSPGSSAGTGVSAPNAAEQSGSAGPTGSQGTLTSPTGAVDSSKATGDSGAQAPSASAQPSGTSTSNTPAGGDGGSATTTTTSSSPSGGKHTKGNADGSDTLTVWVRGTLLLLLTAAVACAAGE